MSDCKICGMYNTALHAKMCARLPLPRDMLEEFFSEPKLSAFKLADKYGISQSSVEKRLRRALESADEEDWLTERLSRNRRAGQKYSKVAHPCPRCSIDLDHENVKQIGALCGDCAKFISKRLAAIAKRHDLEVTINV